MINGHGKSIRSTNASNNGSKAKLDPSARRRRSKIHVVIGSPSKQILILFIGIVTYGTYFIINSRVLFQDTSSFAYRWSSVYEGLWASQNIAVGGRGWATRLAVTRATQDVPYSGSTSASHAADDGRSAIQASPADRRYAAIFLQVGHTDLWDDMLMCAANVAAAVPDGFAVDVYVSFAGDQGGGHGSLSGQAAKGSPRGHQFNIEDDRVRESLNQLAKVDQVYINRSDNGGADMSQFLEQLQTMTKASEGRSEGDYEIILKQHTKRDDIWRQRNVESLCGTPEQVKAIWNNFQDNPKLGIVAPFGTAFGPATPTSHIFPHISRKYQWLDAKGAGPETAFDKTTIKQMRQTQKLFYGPGSTPFENDHLMIVAGSAFWIRREALQPEALVKSYDKFYAKTNKGSAEILVVEHALERLIPTLAVSRGMGVGHIPPAPRVVALYDTKYSSENEGASFGDGLNEWSLLKPLEMDGIRKPLTVENGGLGYYDLMNVNVRKRQGDLARRKGVSGFVFYHYWFSGSNAPEQHKAMFKVQEQMLRDGEPNIPFMLSWANEPLSKRGTGEDEEISLSQDYGDTTEWEEHFLYLLQFFRHPNYIRNHAGQPVFILNRAGHLGSKLSPMIALWRKLALQNGLPGLEIISTVGDFYNTDKGTTSLVAEAGLEGSFHFWPKLMGSGFMDASQTSSTYDLQAELIGVSRQYWGAFTGFNLKPLDKDAVPLLKTVQQFSQSLDTSFRAMAQSNFDADLNLFFITAWNQWNEQAILEPDETNKFGYLDSIAHSLERVPVLPQISRPLFIYHAGPALAGAAGIQCEAEKHLGALLEDGIHYLGGKGDAQCSNGGVPLVFDIRDVSQCSIGAGDCLARQESFSAHVESLRLQKLIAMVSEPVGTDQLKRFLSSIRSGWHIRVLFSYRRYHGWLTDLYSQLFLTKSESYRRWPLSLGDDDLIIPSFPDFYRRMHPTTTDQTQGTKPHPDLLDFVEKLRKEYDDVSIFNIHESIAGSKGSTGDFFCQMVPEAPHLCESFVTDVVSDGQLDFHLSEARSPLLHDRLTVGAHFRGWVDKSLDRDVVRNEVKKRLSMSDEKFPLACLSSAEAKAFLLHSMTTEAKLVPSFHASDMGAPVLYSDFFEGLQKNKFCSEDVERILDNKNQWRPFFRSLHSSPVTTLLQDETAGLHIVISHCQEPVDWIWKRLLVDQTWKSMTIFSKCGKSVPLIDLPPDAHVVTLPNVGRNDHSYAYWIADVFETQEKLAFESPVKADQTLPHEYVKLNPNDSVMFVNDGESQIEGSKETKLPWKEILSELESKGFACGSRVDLNDVHALNVASKKSLGRFHMNARGQVGFRSSYQNLENWVGSLPIDLALGTQALDAREIKLANGEVGGTVATAASASVDEEEGIDLFMPICYGGFFVASVQRIQDAPVGNWGAIEKSLGRGESIEETHFMERIWGALLSRPFSRKDQEDLMKEDFDVIRRRGNRYKGIVTLSKPKA